MKNHDVAFTGRDEARDASWDQTRDNLGDNLYDSTNRDESPIPHRALFIEPAVVSFTLSQIFGQVVTQRLLQKSPPGQNGKAIRQKFQLVLRTVGVSQPTWSRTMAGKSSLTLDTMSDLCDKLSFDFLAILVEVMTLAKKLEDSTNLNGDGIVNYPKLEREPQMTDNENGLKTKMIEKAQRVTITPGQTPRQTIASKDILRYFINQVRNTEEEKDARG
ncbi:MAG: hypothetical protein QM529_00110 [Hydrotalea sp.]|nr:hypothetical protein [Hydrotalea sp.]